MGIDKIKSVYNRNLCSSDKVREMLIASANYSEDVGFYPVQEIVVESAPQTSRKRRLDHLSAEEKIRRKKLKNREAAQTSRDRKKAYVTSLEEAIKLLQKENHLLSERVSLLEEDNKKLRDAEGESVEVTESSAAGPAAGCTPQATTTEAPDASQSTADDTSPSVVSSRVDECLDILDWLSKDLCLDQDDTNYDMAEDLADIIASELFPSTQHQEGTGEEMVGSWRGQEGLETASAVPIEDAVEVVITTDHDYTLSRDAPLTRIASPVLDSEKHQTPSSPHSDLGYESAPSPLSEGIPDHQQLALLFPELM